jgi:hypothetical protein
VDQTSQHLSRLAEVLGARVTEIATEVSIRLQNEVPTYYQVASTDFQDAGYGAVIEVLASAFATFDACGRVPDRLPLTLVDEAVCSARSGVPWEVLARSYAITHEVLADAVVVEFGSWHLRRSEHTLVLQIASRCLFRCFEYLTVEAARVYETERHDLRDQRERDRLEIVNHALRGFAVTDAELGYGTHQAHVGVVGWGRDPRRVVQHAAARLDAELLLVSTSGTTVWAWLGRGEFPAYRQLVDAFECDNETQIALGAVQAGRRGFVATHQHAKLASFVGARHLRDGHDQIVCYPDVAIETIALADESRARTFATYVLGPLAAADSSSMKLRNTLRVYYRLGQNTAAAARELNVAERTVRYRLRLAEERLGASVMPDEVALAIRLFAALEAQAKARPSAVTAANDAAPVTAVEADAEFEPAEDPELDSADPAALLARRFELGAEHHNEIDLAQAERG